METDTIICGAGIAGAATAWALSTAGCSDILIIDCDQPLSLTTASSGENFRSFWPQPPLAQAAQRSIELMDGLQSAGADINLKYSGYEYVSEQAQSRIFDSQGSTRELDIVNKPEEIRSSHPYLSEAIKQLAIDTRAGAVDVQAMGQEFLRLARVSGTRVLRANVGSVTPSGGKYILELDQAPAVTCKRLVLAAGPFTPALARQLGIEMPVENYIQRKIVLPDPEKIIPRDMPFTIFADPQRLDWTDEEREMLAGDPEFSGLLDEFPAGLHIKPESGGQIKMGWAYNRQASTPVREPVDDEQFAEIVMRGAARFIPGLEAYVNKMPTPVVTFSGYYTRTRENWPMIGPLGPDGLYTVSALSGFGTMLACSAAELCAAYMNGSKLPAYARYFHPDRYSDPDVMDKISAYPSDGQL